jgi:hypothetical protein
MKLSRQTCTRVQAGELKALGVTQDSAFIWSPESSEPMFAMIIKPANFWSAAFNTAELGEMLPSMAQTYWAKEHSGFWNWQIIDMSVDEDVDNEQDVARGFKVVASGDGEYDTEAEARAACLITLLEGGLKVSDLNDQIASMNE